MENIINENNQTLNIKDNLFVLEISFDIRDDKSEFEIELRKIAKMLENYFKNEIRVFLVQEEIEILILKIIEKSICNLSNLNSLRECITTNISPALDHLILSPRFSYDHDYLHVVSLIYISLPDPF